MLVKYVAMDRVVFTSHCDHWLKGLERLDHSLEADRPGLDAVPGRRLSRDRTDEIVSQNMCPDLLPDKLWGLATQDVHFQRFFQRP